MELNTYDTMCNDSLSRLQTGKKLWFWFCTGNGDQALLLSEISEDPAMENLTKKIRETDPILGVQQYVGLISITKSGGVEFVSKKSSLAMLYEVSQWCTRRISNIPNLAFLKDSSMVETQEDGSIVNRFSDASLWNTMVKIPVLGTTDHALSTLVKLPKHQTAWFAVASDGNDTRLVVNPVQEDSTGERFATLLKSISMNHSSTLKGTVLRGAERFIFTCVKGNGNEQELFSNLQAHYGKEAELLQTMKLFRLKQSKKKEILLSLRTESPDSVIEKHAIDPARLLELQNNTKLYFYFSDNGNGKDPLLLLSPNRDELKSLAKAHPKAERSLRGSVEQNSKGVVVFQSSKSIEKFLPALVAWVMAQSNPQQYKSIFGARFMQITSDGVVSKEKNDKLWSSIK